MQAVMTMDDKARQRRSRLVLVVVFALFLAPFLTAWFMNFIADWRPAATTQHGELIQPVLPAAELALREAEGGAPLDAAFWEGHWTLLYIAPAACGEDCARMGYVMRQLRLAQGKNIDRVQRALVLNAPDDARRAELAEHYPGMRLLAPAPAAGPHAGLPQADRLYLVDPLGNVMMQYAPDTEPRGIIKDLERLLRISYVG